jgi:tRNA dimethylallyltransferase
MGTTKFKIPCLIGPTAVGKSAVALVLAKQRSWEIISADSRQIYRYMDIGTAKPSPVELATVPHHFIDVRNPDEIYSAGEFAREARIAISEILSRGKIPLVVGGSGLYIRALSQGFFEPAISNRSLQRELKLRAKQEGGATLHAELARVDAVSAVRLHPNDIHRIVRALEVYYSSGKPLSEFWKNGIAEAPYEFHFIGLSMLRDELYKRIDCRVDRMFENGLLDECRKLLEMGYAPELNSLQTVGYKEVYAYLEGKLNEQQMVDEIKKHTRNYAKRQMTWFRKDPNPRWVEIQENESVETIAGLVSAEFGFSKTQSRAK